MTTENLGIDDDLRKVVGQAAGKIKVRPANIGRAINAANEERGKVALVASALIQEKNDELAQLAHEKAQQDEIAARARRLLLDEDPPASSEEADTQPTTSTEQSTAPEGAPTQPQPALRENDPIEYVNPDARSRRRRTSSRRPPVNVLRWGCIQWLLAAVGAILGYVIARYTYHPLFEDMPAGGGRNLVTALWLIALIAGGFWIGGYFGWNINGEGQDL